MARQRSGARTQGLPSLAAVEDETHQNDPAEYPLFELALLTRLRTPGHNTNAGNGGRGYAGQSRVHIRMCAHMQRGCTSITVLICSNGYLLLRCDEPGKECIMKQVPWFQNPQKEIEAIALDPSGQQAVCACMDSSVYIIPIHTLLRGHPTATVKHGWKADDITRIISHKRGIPTKLVWWNSADGKHIVIVGTQDGEVSLIDIAARKAVRDIHLKEEIALLDIVQHPGLTYLLIQSVLGTQWGLLLEKFSTNPNLRLAEIELTLPGYEVIQPSSIPRHSILYAQEGQTTFLPYCFNNFMDIVTLSAQSGLGHNFVAAHDYSSNIFKIFDSSIDNWLPLHVYRLPRQCYHVVLTDRLLFAIYSQDEDTVFGVLSSHLSETRDHQQPPNGNAVMQTFRLPSDESLVAMYKCTFPATYISDRIPGEETGSQTSGPRTGQDARRHRGTISPQPDLPIKLESHTVLEGCILVTNRAVYQCRPRISPEGLFLELAMSDVDASLPDNLGITLGLDMNGLYGLAANRRLVEGQTKVAMGLYHRSGCSQLKQVTNLVSQGYIQEALSLTLSALSKPDQLSTADKRQLSDTAIKCYLHQMLEGRSDEALLGRFKQFLTDNFDYNEIATLEMFAEYGMQDLLFEVARSRGLVSQALEAALTHGSPEIDCGQQCLLVSQGFISTMANAGDNAFLMSMTTQEAVNRLVEKPELCYRYMDLFKHFLDDLKPATLMKLAWLFDPSKPTIKPLLTRAVTTAKARAQNGSSTVSLDTASSDDGSMETALDTCQSFPKPSCLVEFYLRVLIVLNRKRIDQGDSVSVASFDPNADGSCPSSLQLQQEVPVSLPLQRNILACGQFHVAMVSGDDVYTWGKAHGGRLGHGDIIPADGKSTPFRVETLHMHQIRIIAVACGKEHTLALGDEGRLYAWGMSRCGQLGLGDRITHTRPSLVQALTGNYCVAIACGQYHSLALTRDQKVYSWGWGVHGQLGHSCVEDELQPRHVTALDPIRITQISAGYCHTLVLSAEGQVWVCGSGTFGQLGLGKFVMKRTSPTLLDGFNKERVTLVASGLFHNIAVTTNPQKVYIWGKSPLELRQSLQSSRKRKTSRDASGDSVIVGRRRSVTVMESRAEDENQYLKPYAFDCGKICAPIKQVACAMNHNLILTSGGQLYSFGKNDSGQLGLSHRTEQRIPVLLRFSDEHSVAAIGAGVEFSVAITCQGQVFSWGSPENGQLGLDDIYRGHLHYRPPVHTNPRVSKSSQITRLVVSPTLVSGIPLVALAPLLGMNDIEEESDEDDMESSEEDEEVSPDWDLPSLSGTDPVQTPYGPRSLTLSITSLDTHYNHQTILRLCHDHRLWYGAADIAELDKNYSLALLYRLKERQGKWAELRASNEGEGLDETIKLVDKYIRLSCDLSLDTTPNERDTKDSCKMLLLQILQFWAEHDLPQEALEGVLRDHMDKVAYPLSLLLLCDSVEPSSSRDGNEEPCFIVAHNLIKRFTTKFCLEVTSAVVQDVNQGRSCEEYRSTGGIQDLTADRNNTLASLSKGSTGTVTAERLWEEVLHNLAKDNQARAHVTITKTDIAGLVDSSLTAADEPAETSLEKSDSVVFTCGHHYRKNNLQENIIPTWTGKMAALPVPLPSNMQSLSSQYTKKDGLLPMACPNCLHVALQLEQLKQASLDNTSTT